jgi:Protein of unknown function (DUF1428)
MAYVDGFVVPVPKKNLQAYRRLARKAGKSGLVSGGAGIARAEQREENGDGQGNAGRSKKRRNQASACPANVPGAFCRDVEPERAGGAHRRRLQRREPRDCPRTRCHVCARIVHQIAMGLPRRLLPSLRGRHVVTLHVADAAPFEIARGDVAYHMSASPIVVRCQRH